MSTSVPTIDRHDEGPVRVLTIANEAKRNAFSADMAPLLHELMSEADRDPSVRAIVITGAGTTSFSSGHDLAEVLQNPETAGDPVANAAFTLPPSLGTPVIGAINGNACAAGFILALNCDLRVAGSNARFCAVGAKIGLVPVGGQLSRLLHVVTYPVAFKLLATAIPMGAEEALACNLVTEVCEPDETVKRAVALGHVIAEASPAVVRAVKSGLRATLAYGMEVGQALEPQLAEVVRSLPDGDEGVASFLDKRPASYPDAPANLQERLDAVVAGGER
jgi:enoyl-CoA hydratase/carnithine racemase